MWMIKLPIMSYTRDLLEENREEGHLLKILFSDWI